MLADVSWEARTCSRGQRLKLYAVGGCEPHRVTHISEVLDGARDLAPELDLVPTGLGLLDDVVGGFAPGRLWVLTSAPGQGTSTLLIQWAGELSVNAGWLVALHAPREEPARVAERLLASLSRVPRSGRHPWEVRDRDQAQKLRVAAAEESLRASRLSVRAWPSRSGLAHHVA